MGGLQKEYRRQKEQAVQQDQRRPKEEIGTADERVINGEMFFYGHLFFNGGKLNNARIGLPYSLDSFKSQSTSKAASSPIAFFSTLA